MMAPRSGRRGLVWAIAGALVLLIALATVIFTGTLSSDRSPAAELTPTAPATDEPTTASPIKPGDVVDPAAEEQGWVPEPITTDSETYVRAALAAAGTFDTQKSTYEEWLAYLGTWFTLDTRYTSEVDRQTELDAARLELRQGVVLPQTEWDSLAGENGRVAAVVTGKVVLASVPQDASGDMSIGTADFVLTYTRSDGAGGEVTYDESARVSVQVLCGPGSVPAPNSAQQAGDCKVVRFFTEPLEP